MEKHVPVTRDLNNLETATVNNVNHTQEQAKMAFNVFQNLVILYKNYWKMENAKIVKNLVENKQMVKLVNQMNVIKGRYLTNTVFVKIAKDIILQALTSALVFYPTVQRGSKS